jgi:hypothetical protein
MPLGSFNMENGRLAGCAGSSGDIAAYANLAAHVNIAGSGGEFFCRRSLIIASPAGGSRSDSGIFSVNSGASFIKTDGNKAQMYSESQLSMFQSPDSGCINISRYRHLSPQSSFCDTYADTGQGHSNFAGHHKKFSNQMVVQSHDSLHLTDSYQRGGMEPQHKAVQNSDKLYNTDRHLGEVMDVQQISGNQKVMQSSEASHYADRHLAGVVDLRQNENMMQSSVGLQYADHYLAGVVDLRQKENMKQSSDGLQYADRFRTGVVDLQQNENMMQSSEASHYADRHLAGVVELRQSGNLKQSSGALHRADHYQAEVLNLRQNQNEKHSSVDLQYANRLLKGVEDLRQNQNVMQSSDEMLCAESHLAGDRDFRDYHSGLQGSNALKYSDCSLGGVIGLRQNENMTQTLYNTGLNKVSCGVERTPGPCGTSLGWQDAQDMNQLTAGI